RSAAGAAGGADSPRDERVSGPRPVRREPAHRNDRRAPLSPVARGGGRLGGEPMMPPALRPYRAVLSARFRMLLQSRGAAVGGLFTQVFFGLVIRGVYEAFYRSTTRPQPMTFGQLVGYVWLGQALLAMLPWNA